MSGEHAHVFVRGLTLGHLDAVLKEEADARRFLPATSKVNSPPAGSRLWK